MMEVWFKRGGRGERVCKSKGDASCPKFMNQLTGRCKSEIRKGNHVRTHISLLCSPWSKMARISASKSPEDQKKRLEKQNESRHMLRLVIRMIRELRGPI